MKRFLAIFFSLSLLLTVSIPVCRASNWYDGLFFNDSEYTFQAVRAMSYAFSGGADIGECISTIRKIKENDDTSWYKEWLKTADRIFKAAVRSEQNGHIESAKELYLRASNYYRSAGFFMHSKKDLPKAMVSWEKSRKSFLNAIHYMPGVKPISIPYENTTLPGYFVKGSSKLPKPPLLIVQTGFDGTGEELYFETAYSARKRGYNVLIFEGPGQGAVVRVQHLPFRYDWEKVITPVVNYALSRKDVDKEKIALLGISMGGYLVTRAMAFEHRVKVCVADGGIFDFSENIYRNIPPKLIKLLHTNKPMFNKYIYKAMKTDTTVRWFFTNGMFVFGVNSPADVMLTIKKYTVKGVVDKITTRMLIVDSSADAFMKGQARKLYNRLKSPKKYYLFTNKECAQAHCQVGALEIADEVILNHLDDVFKRNHQSL